MLDILYQQLGGSNGRYAGVSYGLAEADTLDELLQTPELWGHDPTDLSYIPAAGNLRTAIEQLIASARETIDICTLADDRFPDGLFLEAIKAGLKVAAEKNPYVVFRILGGVPITKTGGSFEEWVASLEAPSTVPIYIGSQLTNEYSWNHAKLIVVDGVKVLGGGHNLWSKVYCNAAPIHDVSMRITGAAAAIAQSFMNLLWQDVATYSRSSGIKTRHAKLFLGTSSYPNALPTIRFPSKQGSGKAKVLSVARLGKGLVPETYDSNASIDARFLAVWNAKRSIKISQQALDSTQVGLHVWDSYLFMALADAIVHRNIDVTIVISHSGGGTPAGGEYAGWGVKWTADKLAEYVRAYSGKSGKALEQLLTEKLHVAPLHFYPDSALPPDSEAWEWVLDDHKTRWIPGNHAKIFIVDDDEPDACFYVGSDNMYPIYTNSWGLQEFGFICSTEGGLWAPMKSYWDSLWRYSSYAVHKWEFLETETEGSTPRVPVSLMVPPFMSLPTAEVRNG